MSGFGDLSKANRIVEPECPLYERVALSFLLVLADFYPLILTLGSLIWNFARKREALSPVLSIALTLDWGINYVLRVALNQPGPFAVCGCGHTQEMPSFASQHITVFIVVLLLFASVWGGGMETSTVVMSTFLQFLVLFARVYIGINTVPQLYWGMLVGVFEGILMGVILRYTLVPHLQRLIDSQWARRLHISDSYLSPYYYTPVPETDRFTVTDQLMHQLNDDERTLRHRATRADDVPPEQRVTPEAGAALREFSYR